MSENLSWTGKAMSTQVSPFRIVFPDGYDERAQWEHSRKGFLPGVVVQLQDGTRYQLFFMDPVRLGQDLETEAEIGNPYIAEPGLVVIPDVTPEAIAKAVEGLWREGFFKHLRPVG